VLESAALQIRFELILDVARQRPVLGRPPIAEGRIVLGDEPAQQRRLGPMPLITRRRDESRCLRNVALRPAHAVRPCTDTMVSAWILAGPIRQTAISSNGGDFEVIGDNASVVAICRSGKHPEVGPSEA
jgi:hypothetical protein